MSLDHRAAPVEELAAVLEDEHEIKREVTRQVMEWFGEMSTGGGGGGEGRGGEVWAMDVNASVREVGAGILRAYKV